MSSLLLGLYQRLSNAFQLEKMPFPKDKHAKQPNISKRKGTGTSQQLPYSSEGVLVKRTDVCTVQGVY